MNVQPTLDDLIQYWAYLCESKDRSYLDEGRRHGRKRRDSQGGSPKRLSLQEIRERQTKIQQSFANLDAAKVNDFIRVFQDGRSRSIAIRQGNHTYRIWLDRGDGSGGVIHILEHLIDGGPVWSGGFTLAELNDGIEGIYNPTTFNIFNKTRMVIEWVDSHGLGWRLIATLKPEGKRWTVKTIYTKRGEQETQQLSQDKHSPHLADKK